jgi:hypothetical protein
MTRPWALQSRQHIIVDSAIIVLAAVSTRVLIMEHDLLPWLECEYSDGTVQQKCGGNYKVYLLEDCQLEANGASRDYQGPVSTVSDEIDSFDVWLQCSLSFRWGRISSLCEFCWHKYWSYELHTKHWKLCGRKILKPLDPGIYLFHCCIVVGITLRVQCCTLYKNIIWSKFIL